MIGILSISCERDDICPNSTPTTPRVIIDMLDFENQESSKNVFGLVVAGIVDADNNKILPGYAITTTSKLLLPLKTDEDFTEYILIKEASINDNGTPNDTSDDFYNGNQDKITITYNRENIYVSRACGYKTIFNNVIITIENDGDNWLLSQEPLNPNQSVQDETTTHFNLFH